MAAVHRQGYPLRHSVFWDETECLNYYGMLSLHEVFEIVGSQLTETDVEVLSFLLKETFAAAHPLDPAGWTVEPREDDPDDLGVSPCSELLKAWRRLKPQGSHDSLVYFSKPTSGLELLLELERRGYISDGNLEPLLRLLRVLTRHDLLPFVSRKKRRAVSPERIERSYGVKNIELVCTSGMQHRYRQTELPFSSFTQNLGIYPPGPEQSPRRRRRRRKKRGNGWSRKPKKASRQDQLVPPLLPPHKVSCMALPLPPSCLVETVKAEMEDIDKDGNCTEDIRLRVRAEYLEHESALRNGISSDKQHPLERQFELFSQANTLLRTRDLGSVVCDIKFTDLDNLEAFWADYLNGDLLEALKLVFINDAVRMAAGTEGVRLLISVDQDDYEEGRRLLWAFGCRRTTSQSGDRNHIQTRWTV